MPGSIGPGHCSAAPDVCTAHDSAFRREDCAFEVLTSRLRALHGANAMRCHKAVCKARGCAYIARCSAMGRSAGVAAVRPDRACANQSAPTKAHRPVHCRGSRTRSDGSTPRSQHYALLLLAMMGPLRQGECFALVRRDLDFTHNTVDVQATLSGDVDYKLIRKTPKTASLRRKLTMDPEVMAALSRSAPPWPRRSSFSATETADRCSAAILTDGSFIRYFGARSYVGSPFIPCATLPYRF